MKQPAWIRNAAFAMPAFIVAFDQFVLSMLMWSHQGGVSVKCVYFIGAFVGVLVGAMMLRSVTQKAVLSIGLFVYFVSSLWGAFSLSYHAFVWSQLVHGFAAAMTVLSALSYLRDNDTDDCHGWHMWWVFMVVGFAVGPALMDLMIYAFSGFSALFLEAVLSFIAFVGVVAIGELTLEKESKRSEPSESRLAEFHIANVTGGVAYAFIFTLIPVMVMIMPVSMKIDPWHVGKTFLPMTIVFALAFFPLRRIVGKRGFWACLLLGVIFNAVASLVWMRFMVTASYVELIVSLVLFGLGLAAFCYASHNRYSMSMLKGGVARAVRFLSLILGGLIGSIYVLLYAAPSMWLIMLILSLLMLIPMYLQYRIDRLGN